MMSTAAQPFSRRLLTSPGFWSIVTVFAAAWIGLEWLDQTGGGSALRDRLGLAAAAPLVLVHAMASVSPFPGEVVAIGNSMLFGFTLGVVCNWLGWMLGAVIQYGLVRRTTRDLVLHESQWWARTPQWMRQIPVTHPMFLICGRWIPCGGHVVNISAGFHPVPLWRHLWCAAISILPVAVLMAAIGSGLAEIWFPLP